GILPIFQWTKNGINTGTDTNVYSDNNLKNGDVLNCILSSGNTCVTTNLVTSNNVTIKGCIEGFHVPTAFTPNNDGKNDRFMPLLFGNVKQYKFTIYNRWGQVVFQTGEVGKGWDGTAGGVKLDPTIFAWMCTYQLEGERIKTEKGTVVLVR
ncbi:MAG: gliding motility-associated C-terminal domain-containing protein, partial [Chitinophagales bacterium]